MNQRQTSQTSLPRRGVVFVVDDEKAIADLLALILNMNGYIATAFYDGELAVQWALRWKPDCLISDIARPGWNGFKTASRVREVLPHCRILLLSANAGNRDRWRSAEYEVDSFETLGKPTSPDVLLHWCETAQHDVRTCEHCLEQWKLTGGFYPHKDRFWGICGCSWCEGLQVAVRALPIPEPSESAEPLPPNFTLLDNRPSLLTRVLRAIRVRTDNLR